MVKRESYFRFWPARLPYSLDYPKMHLFDIIKTSSKRYPCKPAVIYYGKKITYRELQNSVEALAAELKRLGIKKGDRVAVYMQNTPHFIVSYYGIPRANAVIVPVNPMLLEEELKYLLKDSGAKAVITTGDLYPRIESIRGQTDVQSVIVGNYTDYLPEETELSFPPQLPLEDKYFPETIRWAEVMKRNAGELPPVETSPDDFALIGYTSATTGLPKGCVHTHSTVIANVLGSVHWCTHTSKCMHLAPLPLFHVTGMQHSMNAPFFVGGTMVLFTRWDREAALQAIEKYRCTHWLNITTMVVDLLASPHLGRYDLGSLVFISGGGAPMPAAVAEKLHSLTGLRYVEMYGLTETISQTHVNPPDRPKMQCLGIPVFDVKTRIFDFEKGREAETGQEGELLVNGPQVFKEYWNKPKETREAFVEIDGVNYFKTGDIVKQDEDGYFFIVDRSKRMINAAGYKVWPTEIEGYLYKHEAVLEACVVSVPDPQRVENVKAFIVLKPEYAGKVSEQEIIKWCKERMAAYKYPRIVEFIPQLPKSGAGKILWRVLQEQERERIKREGYYWLEPKQN
ncbi:MAG: long-chain-fatty-acid--CoA ligase [Bacillota bacterium]